MGEGNGTKRLDDHEQRLSKMEAVRKEREELFIVIIYVETSTAARVREPVEFLAGYQQTIQEIDTKFNALIDVVGNGRGGLEYQPS
jgi:hypothetical protein